MRWSGPTAVDQEQNMHSTMSLVALTEQESTAVLELLSRSSALAPVLVPLLKRLQDALQEAQAHQPQSSVPRADTNIGIVRFSVQRAKLIISNPF